MKYIILISILTSIPSLLYGQPDSCGCFTGIGSTEKDRPLLNVEFVNGQKLSICGYENERTSKNEIFVSEFNVFDCATGESFAEYGALRNCVVRYENEVLRIVEVKKLPAADNWEWIYIPIGLQQISVKKNRLSVPPLKPFFEKTEIPVSRINNFFSDLQNRKGKGLRDNLEDILGRLELLALNDNENAYRILMDFETYFNIQTDGAIAEQLTDALATLKWIKK